MLLETPSAVDAAGKIWIHLLYQGKRHLCIGTNVCIVALIMVGSTTTRSSSSSSALSFWDHEMISKENSARSVIVPNNADVDLSLWSKVSSKVWDVPLLAKLTLKN